MMLAVFFKRQLSGDWHLLRPAEIWRSEAETSVRRHLFFQ